MQGEELKALRTGLGMTQGELARRLGLTPTFIGMMERGEKAIEVRTVMAARLVLDRYSVHDTADGRYMVARQTMREMDNRQALASFHSDTRFYGVFRRRDHAYRWVSALKSAATPRSPAGRFAA